VAFAQLVARGGIYNSLAQVAIKITAPGVPDFYQGTELWDFSLVDPDNRRPVDYARRRQLLDRLDDLRRELEAPALAGQLLTALTDPMLKLYTTTALLHARRARDELFRWGDYQGLDAAGDRAAHVFAFRRRHRSEQVIVAVPRLVAPLVADPAQPPLGERTWTDTRVRLPEAPASGHFVDVLTGHCVAVGDEDGRPVVRAADLFQHFPIALLEAR
jgi:(1->4)-alpha-D-glucan 1-alpha-D-glucosylmutase